MVELIYCADGNKRFAQIAIDAGWRYGAQIERKFYHPVYFADQNWKQPNRERYISALRQHKPTIATVLDLEHHEQLEEVLEWGEEAADVVDAVIIIPKAQGIVSMLPRMIGGKQVRLGYSVPTRYAGTELPLWDFVGWPVHLLGGSPNRQMELTHYLDVRSVDGNYAGMMARKFGEFWCAGKWNKLSDTGDTLRHDAIYRSFSRSCRNIMQAWQGGRSEHHPGRR